MQLPGLSILRHTTQKPGQLFRVKYDFAKDNKSAPLVAQLKYQGKQPLEKPECRIKEISDMYHKQVQSRATFYVRALNLHGLIPTGCSLLHVLAESIN